MTEKVATSFQFLLDVIRKLNRNLSSRSRKLPRVFLETDIAGDIDDVAALALLIAEAKLGNCELIGVNANSSNHHSAPCAATILRYFGLEIPVGAYKGDDMHAISPYTFEVSKRFGNLRETRDDFPSGEDNLQKVLSAQPDNSVTLISIGHLSNLYNFLKLDISGSRNSHDLLSAKLEKAVIMGGVFPSGAEYNFQTNPEYASYVLSNFPKDIHIFGIDWNVGNSVVFNFPYGDPKKNPIIYAFELFHGFKSRFSWDLLAVDFAVGTNAKFYRMAGLNGINIVDPATGINTWSPNAGKYTYLGLNIAPDEIAMKFDRMLQSLSSSH